MATRRTFLGNCSALACAAMVDPAGAAEPSRVVDAHVHFYDPTRPQGVPWPSKNEPILYRPTYPERYLSNVRPAHVDGVVAVEASAWLEDNLWLLDVADRNRLVWAVVGNIPPGRREFKDELARFARHPLFRGIRINAGAVPAILAQPDALGDLKLLASKGLSLDILLSGPRGLAEIARLAALLPDLRLVLGHLPLDAPADELRTLGRLPSVYAKVSSVVRRAGGPDTRALDELWASFGPDRVIYASNWPVSDLVAPYPEVFRVVKDYLAGRDSEIVDRFFWKNAAAAYRMAPRV
jgi:L-fuconolactonase